MKILKIDKDKRLISIDMEEPFNKDGTSIVHRKIPNKIPQTLEIYISDLMRGLEIELENKRVDSIDDSEIEKIKGRFLWEQAHQNKAQVVQEQQSSDPSFQKTSRKTLKERLKALFRIR